MTDGTGTTTYAYEPSGGTLQKVIYPDNLNIQYAVDEAGRRQQMTDPFGFHLYYRYNEINLLEGVSVTLNPVGTAGIDEATYTYNTIGQNTNITLKNGIQSTYTYNGPRLQTLTQKNASAATLNQFSYAYDDNNNITDRTENSAAHTFTYDNLDRIATSNLFGETYTYDARGNRAALDSDQLEDFADSTYVYDKKDRLKTATVNGQTVTYTYNGDNLLVERTASGQTTRYYYDGANIIAEANIVGGQPQLKARYIRGNGLVAMQTPTGDTYYYVHNGHGDVIELRDDAGVLLNQYTYDLWGNPITSIEHVPNPDEPEPIGFL